MRKLQIGIVFILIIVMTVIIAKFTYTAASLNHSEKRIVNAAQHDKFDITANMIAVVAFAITGSSQFTLRMLICLVQLF
jgi:hypothetical protein